VTRQENRSSANLNDTSVSTGNYTRVLLFNSSLRGKKKTLFLLKQEKETEPQWLTPVILSTWEADIGRMEF
jgi:hypothetical protein